MRYTPVELRHVKMGRSLFGYNRSDTDRLLEDVADSFEEVWCERGELADKLEDVSKQLEDIKEREALLATTLISAEKAAVDAKELARKEAELALSEAHQEARSIMRAALTERERLFAEARRVETLLRSALGMVEEAGKVPVEEPAAAPESPAEREHWPRREDTREFEAVALPAVPQADDDDGTPLPPPLPPAARHLAGPEEEIEIPWTGKDFAWG
jgi:cell division septum initiation protein DivIVA